MSDLSSSSLLLLILIVLFSFPLSGSNECFGNMPADPAIFRHFDRSWEHSIPRAVDRTLDLAKAENITTSKATIK